MYFEVYCFIRNKNLIILELKTSSDMIFINTPLVFLIVVSLSPNSIAFIKDSQGLVFMESSF